MTAKLPCLAMAKEQILTCLSHQALFSRVNTSVVVSVVVSISASVRDRVSINK